MPQAKATLLAEERTDLALYRTVFAAERTLMAWVRTAISMIGFGFTIYEFFRHMPEQIAGNIGHPHSPRNLGLTLIALGTLALAAASWQHWDFMKRIGTWEKQIERSLSFIVATTVVLIGVIAFCGVLLGVGPF